MKAASYSGKAYLASSSSAAANRSGRWQSRLPTPEAAHSAGPAADGDADGDGGDAGCSPTTAALVETVEAVALAAAATARDVRAKMAKVKALGLVLRCFSQSNRRCQARCPLPAPTLP